jgi:hypothetical protein
MSVDIDFDNFSSLLKSLKPLLKEVIFEASLGDSDDVLSLGSEEKLKMIQDFSNRTKNFVEHGYTNGISKSKKKKPEDHKYYKELLESKGVAVKDSYGVDKESNNLYQFKSSCLQSGDEIVIAVDSSGDDNDSTVVSSNAPPPNPYRKYHDLLVVNCPGYLAIFKLRGVKNTTWFKTAVKFDEFEDDVKKQKTIDVILPMKIEKKTNPLRPFLNNISAPLILNAYYSGETSTLSEKYKSVVTVLKTMKDFKFDTNDAEHVKAFSGRVKFFAYLKKKHEKLHVDLSFLDEFKTKNSMEFFDAATTVCGLAASFARLVEFHFKDKKTAAERVKLPLTKYETSDGDKVGLTWRDLKNLNSVLRKKAATILISDAFHGVLPGYRAYFEKANKLEETDKTQLRSELEQPQASNEDNSDIINATVVVSSKKRKRDIEKKE